MTDLEMTKLCAEAMGFAAIGSIGDLVTYGFAVRRTFRPLHDDAQAMALVKKFRIAINDDKPAADRFEAQWFDHAGHSVVAYDADLNRAIVKCVAKMQAAKT